MGLNLEEQKAVDRFRKDIVEPSMTNLVVLDFWAEWCGPCKALAPMLEKVCAEYADKGVVLAKINVESLPDVEFFTAAKLNGRKQEFGTPGEQVMSFDNKVLTLVFTLPLKTPAKARSFGIEIGDPTYFVAFSIVDEPDAVVTKGAPQGCVVRVNRPPKLDDATQKRLAEADITATPSTTPRKSVNEFT